MRKIQLILAAAGLMAASSLNAQAKPNTEKESKVYFHFHDDSSMIKRAAIGVQVQTTGTRRDTIGVFISRVVPDGPAEKAGIVEGERIVSINGVDLRVAAADVDDSYTAGIASHRLIREMEKLMPGGIVRLQVNSGGRTREVQVTTARASDVHKSSGEMGMMFPRAPRSLSPTRIRVIPSPSRVPMEFNFDDNLSLETPAARTIPVLPVRVKVSGRVRSSI